MFPPPASIIPVELTCFFFFFFFLRDTPFYKQTNKNKNRPSDLRGHLKCVTDVCHWVQRQEWHPHGQWSNPGKTATPGCRMKGLRQTPQAAVLALEPPNPSMYAWGKIRLLDVLAFSRTKLWIVWECPSPSSQLLGPGAIGDFLWASVCLLGQSWHVGTAQAVFVKWKNGWKEKQTLPVAWLRHALWGILALFRCHPTHHVFQSHRLH